MFGTIGDVHIRRLIVLYSPRDTIVLRNMHAENLAAR